MIDLKQKGMPNAINVFGHIFLLNTSFRLWMTYPQRVKSAIEGNIEPYKELFADEYSTPPLLEETVKQMNAFYIEESVLPRGASKDKVIDYDIDADLIYASFMQAYGIDLTENDLHWRKFQALLSGLPSETVMSKIIEIRTYNGKDKDMKQLKSKWALPTELTEEEKEAVKEFNKFFG